MISGTIKNILSLKFVMSAIILLLLEGLCIASGGKVLLLDNSPEALDTVTNNKTINATELFTFLSAELLVENLEAELLPYPSDKDDSSSMATYFSKNPPDASVTAIVWIKSSLIDRYENRRMLTLNVYFPSQKLSIARELITNGGSLPKSAPLAAILVQMIRREKPRYVATKSESRKMNFKIRQAAKVKKAEPSKVELDLLASYVLFPKTTVHMFGISGQLSYFPKAPLAVTLGSGYYEAVDISTSRYDLSYKIWPISAGGRFIIPVKEHELSLDFQMLADITKFSFRDLTATFVPNSTTRVNVGMIFGTSWAWYPTRIIGLCLKLSGAFTPRTQAFIAEDADVFVPGSFSMRLSLGLTFDFSR